MDARQIIIDLTDKTELDEIKWSSNSLQHSVEINYVYTKNVTNKKRLVFEIKTKKTDIDKSELSIKFGPVSGNRYESFISYITPRTQPSLYNLIEILNFKFRRGDIDFIKENVEFKTNKYKDVRTLQLLTKDTISGKLTWKNSFKSDKSATFVSYLNITDKKRLMFTLRCTESSNFKEDNVLRVLLKTYVGDEYKSIVIKVLYLNEYPTLIALISKLCLIHFKSEFKYKPKLAKYEFKNGTIIPVKSIVTSDIEEYRKQIIESINDIIKKLPGGSLYSIKKFSGVFDALDGAKTASTFEELNDFLHNANLSYEMNNPVGNPKWAN